ncbi:response regulator transcription factor [Butyricimonas paravirosa]
MKLYASGKSVDVIAGMLFISINTVKNHIKNAFRKVGVHSLAEFIQHANSHNLFKS